MFKLFVVLAFAAAASAQVAWTEGRPGVPNNGCPQRPYEQNEFPVLLRGSGCNDFSICDNGLAYPFTCPSALNWDNERWTCNWAEEAPCNGRRWFTAEEIPPA